MAALDAWVTLASGPLRESRLPEPGPERERALKRARTRRAVLVAGGTLAVLDLCCIAIWLASGADYFWPVWPLFGSAVLAVPAIAVARR